MGLDYLTLARAAGTLSGGESQRIRLTTQIGSALSGVLYVLDEPSIGLHQRDNDKLIATLKNLRDLGNTVIVVEHDEDTMRSADYIVDVAELTLCGATPDTPCRYKVLYAHLIQLLLDTQFALIGDAQNVPKRLLNGM